MLADLGFRRGAGDGNRTPLSALESDRSGALTALSWAVDVPPVTVTDPATPGLMAHANGPSILPTSRASSATQGPSRSRRSRRVPREESAARLLSRPPNDPPHAPSGPGRARFGHTRHEARHTPASGSVLATRSLPGLSRALGAGAGRGPKRPVWPHTQVRQR